MIHVSTHATDDDVTDGTESSMTQASAATIESYETEDGVVFYDANNPLAWVETSRPISLVDLA